MDTSRTVSAAAQAGGILVVDDHKLVRLGFHALVHSQATAEQPALTTVFEARELAEALALYDEHRAEISVVVLDLNLPDSHGMDGLMAFRQRYPEAIIVVLSGTDDTATVQGVLALGAVAFFSKSGDLGDMLGFVQACVLHGPAQASQQLARAADAGLDGNMRKASEAALAEGKPLSTRQLQILQWVLDGQSNREIGERAYLSEGTVKNHVSTLLLSFGVRSRAQLISKLRA